VKTIFIHQVHAAATEASLADYIGTFNLHVTPSDISLPRKKDGAAKGFALVRFQSEEDAKRAVTCLDNAWYKAQQLHVELAQNELGSKIRLDPYPAVPGVPIKAITGALPFKEPAPETEYQPSRDQRGHDLAYWSRLKESWRWLDKGKAQSTPLRDIPAKERAGVYDPRKRKVA
jgi:RNA recognition motif-containing protein